MDLATQFSGLSTGVSSDALASSQLSSNNLMVLPPFNSREQLDRFLHTNFQLLHSSFTQDRPSLPLATWTLPNLDNGVLTLSAISPLPAGEYQIQVAASTANNNTFVANTQLVHSPSAPSNVWQIAQSSVNTLPAPFTPPNLAGVGGSPYDPAALMQVIQTTIANATVANRGIAFQITFQGRDGLVQEDQIKAQFEQIIQNIVFNAPSLPM